MSEETKRNLAIAMDWDDVIVDDGQELIILEEGEYNFVVTECQRGIYSGSDKIPSCNQATITMRIDTPDGAAYVRENLYLVSTLAWQLAAFFRCIGQKKRGEKLRMDWSKVKGAHGHAYVKPRVYKDKSGIERTANSIDHYFDWKEKYFRSDESGFIQLDESGEKLPFD